MTFTEFVILGLATSAMGYYLASAEVFAPPRKWVQKHTRAQTIEAGHRMAEGRTTVNLLVLGWWRWLSGMVVPHDIGDPACRICVGQWAAFATYWAAVAPPWQWGWVDLVTTVAMNGLHIVLLQATYIDLDGAIGITSEGDD